MKLGTRFLARLSRARGQTIVEYALVIVGISLVTLFTGYQPLGNIINNSINSVVGLF